MRRFIDGLALVILLIGGINWGLIGVFDYNLVERLLGVRTGSTLFVYTLVGIAALYYILSYFIQRGKARV